MAVAKKKEETVEQAAMEPWEIPFGLRFAQVGALVRQTAKETLKFDSEVANIDYTYVDTSQYKELLGLCVDQIGVGITIEIEDEQVEVRTDNKGVMLFIANVKMKMTVFDPWDAAMKPVCLSAVGLGVSRGSGYAFSIAQTNAMRNLITNSFLLGTSDRENDDVRENFRPSQYLTDSAKAEKRAELLDKTKSTAVLASIMYGEILLTKLEETLDKDIPDEFRKSLETFKATKFKDGKPIATGEDPNLWIVKKTAANKIMSDLEQY